MKRTLFLFLLSCFIITSSCRYDDGPAISFRSREKRLEGTWLCKYFTVDGVDSLTSLNTLFGSECKFLYGPVEDFHALLFEWGDTASNYYWANADYVSFRKEFLIFPELQESAISTSFPFAFLNDSNPWGMRITRLKFDEFWFTADANNKNYELHFTNISKGLNP